MFIRLAVPAAVLMVGAGCSAPQNLGDAALLSRALRAEYHRPVTVTLDGQRRLIVTLEADSTSNATNNAADSTAVDAGSDSATPAAQAYRVARYVGSHYDHAGTLQALTVIVEPAAGDSASQPSVSKFSPGEFAPKAARPANAPIS